MWFRLATRDRSRNFVWKFIFIFALSAIVVTLFWFHEELYQLGLGMLILITGFCLIAITWVGLYVLSGKPLIRKRAVSTMSFQPEERKRVLRGTQRMQLSHWTQGSCQ